MKVIKHPKDLDKLMEDKDTSNFIIKIIKGSAYLYFIDDLSKPANKRFEDKVMAKVKNIKKLRKSCNCPNIIYLSVS